MPPSKERRTQLRSEKNKRCGVYWNQYGNYNGMRSHNPTSMLGTCDYIYYVSHTYIPSPPFLPFSSAFPLPLPPSLSLCFPPSIPLSFSPSLPPSLPPSLSVAYAGPAVTPNPESNLGFRIFTIDGTYNETTRVGCRVGWLLGWPGC